MVGGIEKWTDGEFSSVYGSTSWKNRIGRTAGGQLIVSEVKGEERPSHAARRLEKRTEEDGEDCFWNDTT